ncbi:YesL family protein [Bacillus sp. SD088]|uniref:YesL family protein n=1 Tax=Bacillus sp. SD088 TaxID=2782012 RepID=UPI001A9746C7|nr:DUF624 domain-containing protein [Bacillus sp. SD088]MBO0993142.1 DUF624 domain-containing protein [Bacillus sp. SD088]
MGDSSSSGTMEGISNLFEWIAKLAYLNLLWILFSVVGLGVLGVGPATVSVFTIIRQWLHSDRDFSIWKTFIETYRQEFWRANGLTLLIAPVCLFVFVDFAVIRTLPTSFLIDFIVFPAVIILSLITIVAISYLFATYVHFNVPFWVKVKYALLIAGLYPLSGLLILVGLFIFAIIAFIIPAIIPFYAVSVPAFIIQISALRAFRKLASQQKVINDPKR